MRRVYEVSWRAIVREGSRGPAPSIRNKPGGCGERSLGGGDREREEEWSNGGLRFRSGSVVSENEAGVRVVGQPRPLLYGRRQRERGCQARGVWHYSGHALNEVGVRVVQLRVVDECDKYPDFRVGRREMGSAALPSRCGVTIVRRPDRCVQFGVALVAVEVVVTRSGMYRTGTAQMGRVRESWGQL